MKRRAVTSRLALITSAEPFVRYHADSTSANGTAELFLGAQVVLSQCTSHPREAPQDVRYPAVAAFTGAWPGAPGTGAFLQCGTLQNLHDQR